MKKKVICPVCDGYGFTAITSEYSIQSRTCDHCNGSGEIEVPMTNDDRMNAMSIEEKARFLTAVCAAGCPPKMDWDCAKDESGWDACDACWCKWLQQPVDDATPTTDP